MREQPLVPRRRTSGGMVAACRHSPVSAAVTVPGGPRHSRPARLGWHAPRRVPATLASDPITRADVPLSLEGRNDIKSRRRPMYPRSHTWENLGVPWARYFAGPPSERDNLMEIDNAPRARMLG